VDSATRWFNAFLAALAGLLLGAGGAGLVVVAQEVTGGKLKTAADVKRVTGLPVLAALGDLEKMSPEEKDAWAFRTWTAISGQLNPSPNHGLVCGFISAGASEGRSTWIRLLADAAKKRGLQVMTISAGTTATATAMESPVRGEATGTTTNPAAKLTSFADISLPLAARDTQHGEIALPGAVWNLARRKEWQNTLAHLRQMDNLVVLIELPPASLPESVLMAESLPQVIWLADSGKSSARETRQQLETLRHGRCRLAGAVLNHEPKPMFEL
jgi:Mrp family chromosome partitioning ATPase